MTDGNDVKIASSPFLHPFPHNKVYCGSENNYEQWIVWIIKKINHIQHRDPTVYKELYQILSNAPNLRQRRLWLNAGILGGHRDVVLNTLENICARFTENTADINLNMPVFVCTLYVQQDI